MKQQTTKLIATINNINIHNGDNLDKMAASFGSQYKNFEDLVETRYEIEELFGFVTASNKSVCEGYYSREQRNADLRGECYSQSYAYFIDSALVNSELLMNNINYLVVEVIDIWDELTFEFYGFEDVESAQARLKELEESRYSNFKYIESLLPKEVTLSISSIPKFQYQSSAVQASVLLGGEELEHYGYNSDVEDIKTYLESIKGEIEQVLNYEGIKEIDDEDQLNNLKDHLRTLKFYNEEAKELNERRIQMIQARLDELEA